MKLDDQIKFIQDLDNSVPKIAVLETLKLWKNHFPKAPGNSVLIGMSGEEYKLYLEFMKFLKFKKKQP